MVVIAARFPGKCKRCSKPIAPGALMDWEKGAGATHVNQAACDAAPEQMTLRGPTAVEDPEERMKIVELLLAHPWQKATSKRYEKLPHEYTLRRLWSDNDEFNWCAHYIQRVGYEQHFIGRVWTYYDIGEHQYWNCDGPLEKSPLINRAVRREVKKP
jgi:hypothetical protein